MSCMATGMAAHWASGKLGAAALLLLLLEGDEVADFDSDEDAMSPCDAGRT
jgi:hypothetical protein